MIKSQSQNLMHKQLKKNGKKPNFTNMKSIHKILSEFDKRVNQKFASNQKIHKNSRGNKKWRQMGNSRRLYGKSPTQGNPRYQFKIKRPQNPTSSVLGEISSNVEGILRQIQIDGDVSAKASELDVYD